MTRVHWGGRTACVFVIVAMLMLIALSDVPSAEARKPPCTQGPGPSPTDDGQNSKTPVSPTGAPRMGLPGRTGKTMPCPGSLRTAATLDEYRIRLWEKLPSPDAGVEGTSSGVWDYTWAFPLPKGFEPVDIAVGDPDNDGTKEVVFSAIEQIFDESGTWVESVHTFFIYEEAAKSWGETSPSVVTPAAWHELFIVDMDADRSNEVVLVIGTAGGGHGFAIFSYVPRQGYVIDRVQADALQAIIGSIGDLSGDGILDIVGTTWSGTLIVWEQTMRDTWTFHESQPLWPPGSEVVTASYPAIVDVDESPGGELVLSEGNWVAVIRYRGGLFEVISQQYLDGGAAHQHTWTDVKFGDLDGDGLAEMMRAAYPFQTEVPPNEPTIWKFVGGQWVSIWKRTLTGVDLWSWIVSDLDGDPDTKEIGLAGSYPHPRGSSSGTYACVAPSIRPPSGLVSWWPGDGTAYDAWGANDGALLEKWELVDPADFPAFYGQGEVGKAFRFDGNDDWIRAPNSGLDGLQQLTMDAWVKMNSNSPPPVSGCIAPPPGLVGWWPGDGSATDYVGVNGGTLYGGASYSLLGKVGQAFRFDGVDDAIGAGATGIDGLQQLTMGGWLKMNSNSLDPDPNSIPPPPGLVSWWPGDGTPTDFVGPNLGTLVNGASFADGKVGQAFSFDGIDDTVNAPGTEIDGMQELTIDFWLKMNTIPPGQAVDFVTLHGGGATEKAVLRSDGGPLHFFMGIDGATRHIRAYNALRAGVWQHIAGTYDGTAMRLYFDGAEVGNFAVNGTVGIGNGLTLGWDNMDGLLDEVQVFNRALSAAEVKAIYDAGAVGQVKPPQLPYRALSLFGMWGKLELIYDGTSGPRQLLFKMNIDGQWPHLRINNVLKPDTWQYLAGTFDGAAMRVYMDGVEVGSLAVNGTVATSGRVYLTGGDGAYLDGLLDEVQVFDRALSAQELRNMYLAGGRGQCKSPQLPDAFIRFVTVGSKATLRYDGADAPGTLDFDMNIDGVYQHVHANNVLRPDIWQHVAGTYDGATMRLYLDGVEVGSLAVSGVVGPTVDVSLGSRSDVADELLDGLLDEAQVFDRALSDAEIKAIYDAGSAGQCKPPNASKPAYVYFEALRWTGIATITLYRSPQQYQGTAWILEVG